MAKGAQTRDAILRRAVSLASVVGLEGLTIGGLASEMGLSKSGLISHFGTKETLQLAVLQAAATMFGARVVVPARRAPAGEPRVRALFEKWLEWPTSSDLPGGCPFVTATAELDDRPGVCRVFLTRVQREWFGVIQQAVREAKETGHFRRELDPMQFAFDMYAIFNAFHGFASLMNDRSAEGRARAAFEGLVRRARGEYRPVTREAMQAENPTQRIDGPTATPPSAPPAAPPGGQQKTPLAT
jgi:AcrR family transcriptional regulator